MRNLFEIPSEKKVRLFFKTDEKNMTLISVSPKATLNSTGYGINDVNIIMNIILKFLFNKNLIAIRRY
jgi:hypothetical protein